MDATTINRNDPEGNNDTSETQQKCRGIEHDSFWCCSSDKEILINVHVAPFR